MRNRLRLLMGATALLYLGPLMAGLGGFGWAVVPVFALIFVLWLIILRPHQWPRHPAEWTGPALLTAVTQVLVQVLLVSVCFGIGRGIGGVLGALPPFPVMLPIAVSFLSIPLSRLIWDPWKGAEMDRFLDDAIRQINDPGYRPVRAEEAEAAIAPVLALPEHAADAEAVAAIATLFRAGCDHRDALITALDTAGPGKTAGRRGFILWATAPDTALENEGLGLVRDAHTVTWTDPGLLALFLGRALPLIRATPHLWFDFPDLQALHFDVDAANPPALNDALRELIAALEQAMGPENTPPADDPAAA